MKSNKRALLFENKKVKQVEPSPLPTAPKGLFDRKFINKTELSAPLKPVRRWS